MPESGSIEAILLGAVENRHPVVGRVRASCKAPIIGILDGRALSDTLQLFTSGVDDVVVKPFHVREILARIGAIRRRTMQSDDSVEISGIRVFFDGQDPLIDGKPLPLPRRERRILEYLVLSRNLRVTKTQIFNRVYGVFNEGIHENVIESHISRLRKRLQQRLGHDPINSQRYLGYRLVSADGRASEGVAEAALTSPTQAENDPLVAILALTRRISMGLYGVMTTSVSGMSAQADRLGTVADNIANINTTGYKRSSTQFSTLVPEAQLAQYTPGSVATHIVRGISEQGELSYTRSTTDLAINGNGFFMVQSANGTPYLTRAGSFVPNSVGELVNSAGYKLLGYNLAERELVVDREQCRRTGNCRHCKSRLAGRTLDDSRIADQLSGWGGCDRCGRSSVGQRSDGGVLRQDLGRHLRQHRQRSVARYLFGQNRSRHLGSHDL